MSKKRREVYALFDKKMGVYGSIKDFSSVVDMSREFEMFVKNMDGKYYMSNHLDEYAVYKIGEFDNETGEIVKCEPVVMLELVSLKGE